jgi:hypothetical protein
MARVTSNLTMVLGSIFSLGMQLLGRVCHSFESHKTQEISFFNCIQRIRKSNKLMTTITRYAWHCDNERGDPIVMRGETGGRLRGEVSR